MPFLFLYFYIRERIFGTQNIDLLSGPSAWRHTYISKRIYRARDTIHVLGCSSFTYRQKIYRTRDTPLRPLLFVFRQTPQLRRSSRVAFEEGTDRCMSLRAMCVNVCICVRMCLCMFMCMYVCMCVCLYVCMYVCMWVGTWVHTYAFVRK